MGETESEREGNKGEKRAESVRVSRGRRRVGVQGEVSVCHGFFLFFPAPGGGALGKEATAVRIPWLPLLPLRPGEEKEEEEKEERTKA